MSATPDPQPANDGGIDHEGQHKDGVLNGDSEAPEVAGRPFEPMDEGEEFGDFRDAHDDDDLDQKSGTANDRMLEYLEEAREEMAEERAEEGQAGTLGNGSGFKKFQHIDTESEGHGEDHGDEDLPAGGGGEGSEGAASPAPPSSVGSLSNPDDTPSAQSSIVSSSLAGSGVTSARVSPSPSLRPFDRRFQSRLTPGTASPALSPSLRAGSPSFAGGHSRNSSIASRLNNIEDLGTLDEDSAPWDVVRWTKLKKTTAQLYSDAGRRNFGIPTCIIISATIAIGTDKGLILVFDYSQGLKAVIGAGTKAVECGPVTALAVSADHTMIAGGHANAHIFTWELTKSARPFMHIPPLPDYDLDNRKHDGHITGVAVLHLGFLGTRRTALASADSKGMAFSHLATRGLGKVARIVKTTRILGRYPGVGQVPERPRKPSTVLGFSVLPLGNTPERTDSMGLVAMLTPYLLVIVSTTPIAQTQYKAARPKEIGSDHALTGCLAWYPAVKKAPPSKTRLVYAWSNILTLLEVSIAEGDDPDDAQRPPNLEFKARSRFRCDEPIVSVQWMSRQVIAILTISQRLMILEDISLRVTETFDLMSKHILHRNVFGAQLQSLVDRMDEEGSVHRQIADAYYNSFKAYKGRLFILGFYDVSVGVISNWADRLLAMMEAGDYIGAISLATSYYSGDVNKLTIGLPVDPAVRHPLVEEKLIEMMAASLRYAFGKNQNARKDVADPMLLQQLASACFEASVEMNRVDFLFDVAFDFYEQSSQEGTFLETLEPYILDRRISVIPPTVVKALIKHYTSLELDSRLEEMICQLETATLDIDQTTRLCREHRLYDAMIYVWNRALGDYITPMIDLLKLLVPLVGHHQDLALQNGDSGNEVDATKLFPYLAYTWTGRVYPTGEELSEPEASNAKAQLYYLLFLGRTITWPKHGGKAFRTWPESLEEPSFPYLRLILQYDASSFLSAMNEAFEDPFLNGAAAEALMNGSSGKQLDASEEQVFGRSVNRQYIVSILLEVMGSGDFPPQDTIYLDMFIARNLPKYPQFVLLSGSSLHRVLVGLCNPPGHDIADDCQLSVEYLLTVYRPPDSEELVRLFTEARFFRVLKAIFRSEKKYAKLVQTYFDDQDAGLAVFDAITECLRPKSGLTTKQISEVKEVIEKNAREMVTTDTSRAALVLNSYAPDLHRKVLKAVEDMRQHQFLYIKTILEPTPEQLLYAPKKKDLPKPDTEFVELYIRLMCEFEPEHVSEYVRSLQSGDLRLENVIPAMENTGVMDAAVVLMAREGQIRKAMDRLISHLGTLESSLIGIIEASKGVEDAEDSNKAAKEILLSLQKYARVGIWLAQGQMKSAGRLLKNAQATKAHSKRRSEDDALNPEETLWLDLIDPVVRIAKYGITASASISPPEETSRITLDSTVIATHLRQFVQETFSALLAATSIHSNVSFLHILRAFLSRAALTSPSLSDLHSVLRDIFEAYLYEEKLLSLANSFLDKDLFVDVRSAVVARQRGWRPQSQSCEVCGKRTWGPGAAGGIYSAWEKKRVERMKMLEYKREERKREAEGLAYSEVTRGKRAGGKVMELDMTTDGKDETEAGQELIVLSCRHLFHKKCLEGAEALERGPGTVLPKEVRCVVCGPRTVH